MHRLAALLMSTALLWVPTTVIGATAPVIVCTYTFPDGGGRLGGDGSPDAIGFGSHDYPVIDGDVICGGPGDDTVVDMEGGVFYGRGGNDTVIHNGGVFYGGPGNDSIKPDGDGLTSVNSDIFYGGSGNDFVYFNRGLFNSGPGNDRVNYLESGAFDAGDGDDAVDMMIGGIYYGGNGADHVAQMLGGVFEGGAGNDRATSVYAGTYRGGSGRDVVAGDMSGGRFYGQDGGDADPGLPARRRVLRRQRAGRRDRERPGRSVLRAERPGLHPTLAQRRLLLREPRARHDRPLPRRHTPLGGVPALATSGPSASRPCMIWPWSHHPR